VRGTKAVSLILEGSVRVIDPDDPRPGHSQTVVSGHYIGERAALFDEPRDLRVGAIDRVRALVIPGDRFFTLIHEWTLFVWAAGIILPTSPAATSAPLSTGRRDLRIARR